MYVFKKVALSRLKVRLQNLGPRNELDNCKNTCICYDRWLLDKPLVMHPTRYFTELIDLSRPWSRLFFILDQN